MQSKETSCGSSSSNQVSKYKFPNNKNIRCYATYGQAKFNEEVMTQLDGKEINYTVSSRSVSAAKGLINDYDGSGFIKDIKLNRSDIDYFKTMVQKELIDSGWFSMNSTLAVII